MQSPPRLAAKGFLALAIGLLSLGGEAAHAQADPFALPENATTAAATRAVEAGPGVSEIEVDGSVKARLVELRGQGNAMTIDADAARVAGLPVPDDARGQVPLSSLRLYQWKFDSLRQRLSVVLYKKAEDGNFRDFAHRDQETPIRKTITSFRLDYALNASVNPQGAAFGGLFGAALVKGGATIASAAQVTSAPNGSHRVTRLDSFVRGVIPGTTTVATLGDFTSKGSASQRALRLGGVQIASDFSQQPNLVTQPLPGFKGTIAVPTSVDIVTADSQLKIGALDPGDFAIRNIPTSDGRGSMTVQLKDSLGRIVSQILNFYSSATLLRPGLSAYAVNAGFVRRRYGDADADYGALAASAFYRRGLSPFLTVEGSGESTAGLVNFGLKSDFTIGNIALASVELRGSHHSSIGTGRTLNAGLESIGRIATFRLGASIPTSKYRDVASRLGDRPPPRQVFADITYQLAPRLPVRLTYLQQIAPAGDFDRLKPRFRSETLTLGMQYSPNQRMNFNLSAGFQSSSDRLAGARAFVAAATLDVRLGRRHSAALGASRGLGQSFGALNYRYDDVAGSGLRAQASAEVLDGKARIGGLANYDASWASLQSAVVVSDGRFGGNLTATGAIVAVDGGVHMLQNPNASFLLVRSDGVAGIPVLVDSRYVGKTGHDGKLFVSSILPNAIQRIDVDGNKLPDDAIVTAARHVVTVPAQAVGVLDIAAMYYRPVVLQIVDEAGAKLAPGLRVTARPSGKTTQMGYEGLLEFNSAGRDRRLEIEVADGTCVIDVPESHATGMADTPLSCRAQPLIVESEADLEARTKLAGRKVARRD